MKATQRQKYNVNYEIVIILAFERRKVFVSGNSGSSQTFPYFEHDPIRKKRVSCIRVGEFVIRIRLIDHFISPIVIFFEHRHFSAVGADNDIVEIRTNLKQ